MVRVLAVLIVLLALVPARAQDDASGGDEGPVHAGEARACADCHDDPHPAPDTAPCASCHGTTGWLPTSFSVADHAETALPLEGAHVEVACGQCHVRHKLTGLPTECAGCHVDRHRGLLGDDCASCHAVEGFTPVEGFEHGATGFELDTPHQPLDCAACHEGEHARALRTGAGPGCTTCHAEAHADFDGDCVRCHRPADATFAAARASGAFDHATTGFELHRRHGAQPCASCHPVGAKTPPPRCGSCHVDPHAGQLGSQCADCHRADRWRLARFDHDLTGWALRGRHFVTPCADCHVSERWVGLTTECWDCHAGDAARAPAAVPAHRSGRVTCGDCHGTWHW